MSKKSVPFRANEVYSGFAELNGILHADEKAVTLEFQVKDSILGVLKSRAKTIRIPYSDLVEARYKVNFFQSKFYLHLNNMQLISQFPAAKDGVFTLKVKRSHKFLAKEVEHAIRYYKSEGETPLIEPNKATDPFLQ